MLISAIPSKLIWVGDTILSILGSILYILLEVPEVSPLLILSEVPEVIQIHIGKDKTVGVCKH